MASSGQDLQEGDEAGWKWGGSGHPTGTVTEVNAEGITIEGKSGAPVHRNGTEEDPAIKLNHDGTDVVKRAHELHKTGEASTTEEPTSAEESAQEVETQDKQTPKESKKSVAGDDVHKKNTEAHQAAMKKEEAKIKGQSGESKGKAPEEHKETKETKHSPTKPKSKSETKPIEKELNAEEPAPAPKGKGKTASGDIKQHNQDIKAASMKQQQERIGKERATRSKTAANKAGEESSDADEDVEMEDKIKKNAGDKRTRADGTPDITDDKEAKQAKGRHGESAGGKKPVATAKQTKAKEVEVEA